MNSPIPIAILAGGLATRLHPLTKNIPKALVDVAGRPFVDHQLRLLHDRGISHVVLCAGHLGDVIQAHVGDGSRYGLRVDYSFDGPRLLGTAGAIKKALPFLGQDFFVMYGDSYLPCDFAAVQDAHHAGGKLGLMTVCKNDDQWDHSNVEFADGLIIAYDKRNRTPKMRHIDYGLGVFKSAAFDLVPDDQPFDLATLYARLLECGQLAGLDMRERFYEIGSNEGLEELSRRLVVQGAAQPCGDGS